MFLGSYVHSLDGKNRLTIPAKFRDRLATGLVLTPHPEDPCLLLFPQAEWDQLAEKIGQLAVFNSSPSMLRRRVFSNAEDLKPDGQGRIVINQRLRDMANIQSEVMVAGLNTFVELWDPAAWQEHVDNPRDGDATSRDLFAALGI